MHLEVWEKCSFSLCYSCKFLWAVLFKIISLLLDCGIFCVFLYIFLHFCKLLSFQKTSILYKYQYETLGMNFFFNKMLFSDCDMLNSHYIYFIICHFTCHCHLYSEPVQVKIYLFIIYEQFIYSWFSTWLSKILLQCTLQFNYWHQHLMSSPAIFVV